jgi:hypothetical protein
MKGGQVRVVEAEGTNAEGENQWGPSRMGR